MAEGRRGLGRGLSALLGESEAELASAEARDADRAVASAAARETPIELLRRNPDQPRRQFVEGDINELADSIREVGILQPILVRPAPGSAGDYQIVAGERRWRAAQMAGLKTVPILVRELDDLAVLEIGIIENVQRADLNPVEEALGYRALIERLRAQGRELPSALRVGRQLVLERLATQGVAGSGEQNVGFHIGTDANTAFMIGGDNQLQFAFQIPPNDLGRCRSAPPTELFAAIDPQSTIDLTAFRHYLAMPNLAAYANSGFPFTRVPDLAQTSIILPNQPTTADVLAAAQAFHDKRLLHQPGLDEFERLEAVGEQAVRVFDQPDAGMWELRTRARVHTSSALMCWAACDRLAKIAHTLELPGRALHWSDRAAAMRDRILRESWSEERQAFAESFGGRDLDASVLLMVEVGFIDPMDPRFVATLAALEEHLCDGPYMRRYEAADDFGKPETAFNICTFWRIDALARTGRKAEARAIFETMLAARNPLGMLSEDTHATTGEMWGNYPQTYSMVGIINAAMRLSATWDTVI